MDVRCERCNTEYEFDESKVTEAGVTVKCANCGNLFKVRRRGDAVVAPGAASAQSVSEAAAAAADPAGERLWMVKHPVSGEIRRFRELTTLQQWIVERKVTRDDQISRTGETWKSLGDIAELASFFQVVDMATRRTPAPPSQPAPSPPTGGHAYAPTLLGMQSAAAAAAATAPMPAPTPPPAYSPPPPAPQPIESGPVTLGSMPSAVTTDPSFEGTDVITDDEFNEMYPGARSRRGLAIGLAALIVGAAGIGLYAQRGKLPGLFGQRATPGADSLRMGREAFLLDTDEGFIQADHEFQLAQGASGSARALGGLAEVYSTWTLYLREDARLLDERARAAQAGDAAALRARAEEKRREAEQKLLQAKLNAAEAIAHTPDDPDVARAYSLYLVASNAGKDEVQRYVGKARGGDPETLYVEGALLLRDGRADEARRVLGDAVARSGDHPLLRAQYLLASAQLALGQKDAAREILERMLKFNGRHERAKTLLESLRAPPAPPAVAAAPTAPPTAAPAAPPATQPAAPPAKQPGAPPAKQPPAQGGGQAHATPAATPARTEKPAAEGGGGNEGLSYEALVARGNKLLEAGKDSQARAAFEAALKLRPQGPEAQTGLGNYFVNVSKTALGVLYFQKAADHGYGEAFFYLAEAQKANGAVGDALANYRKYLAMGGRGENVGIAQRAIRELTARLDNSPGAPKPAASPPPPPPPPPPPAPPASGSGSDSPEKVLEKGLPKEEKPAPPAPPSSSESTKPPPGDKP